MPHQASSNSSWAIRPLFHQCPDLICVLMRFWVPAMCLVPRVRGACCLDAHPGICVEANGDDTSWVLTCLLPLAHLGCSCSWRGLWSLRKAAACRDERQNWPSRRCCPGASRNITARSACRPWGVAQKMPKPRRLWSSSVMKTCVCDLVCLLNRIVTYVLVKSFLSPGISVGRPGGRLSDQVARCVFPYSNR